MTAHLRYLSYVLRHKWFVFVGCLRLGGVPLWAAVVHDWTKFLPVEWFPYVRKFYGPQAGKPKDAGSDARSSKGYFHRAGEDEAFDTAWLHHIHGNPHHWQYWLLLQSDGTLKPLPMPERYTREMVADWYGAGMAQGKPDIVGWYEANKHSIIVHPATRGCAEMLLEEFR